MKVLHIGKYFHPSRGGIESFLMDLSHECASQGAEQGVLVHTAASMEPGQDTFPHLRYFARAPTLATVSYAPLSPAFPRELARAIETFKPDLLDLHMPNPSAFWALFSRPAQKLPWVIHWHADASGPEFSRSVRLLYPPYRLFEQRLLARARAVIATSEPYLTHSPALRRWQEKCRVIPIGLDPSRVNTGGPEETPWQSESRLRVLAVGRLTPYKGFEILLHALARTRAELIIAGTGADAAQLRRKARHLGLSDRVRLTGEVSDASRNALLASCDLLCLPSLNRAEAFGISVLESMAAGKAAAVSKIPGSGLPWLVHDPSTGWHFKPGDAASLALTLNHIDADRDSLMARGQAARQRFEKHFHISAIARQTLALQKKARGSSVI